MFIKRKISFVPSLIFLVLFILCLYAGKVSANEIVLDIPIPSVNIAIQPDGSTVLECNSKNVQYLNPGGEPEVPYEVVHILLPSDADLKSVSVKLINKQEEKIDGSYDIKPTAALKGWEGEDIWPEGKIIVDGKDIDIYYQNAVFPSNHLNHSPSTGLMRTKKLVRVSVALFRCNPVTGEVYRLDRGQISVNFESGSIGPESSCNDPIGEKRAREMCINYDSISSNSSIKPLEYSKSNVAALNIIETANSSTSSGYAIITTNRIKNGSSQLQNFVAHKESLGFDVHVITEETWDGWIGDTAAHNLFSWIKNNYLAYNLEYVLLIGNPHQTAGDLPMYDDTDDYYCFPTGNMERSDLLGYYDIMIGRIPCYGVSGSDIPELDSILAKTITYENETSTAWRKKALILCGPSEGPFVGPGVFTKGGEAVKDRILVPEGIPYYRMYDEEGVSDYKPEFSNEKMTKEDVTNEWTSSSWGVVYWGTHGTGTKAMSVTSSEEVKKYDNSKPVFTFQYSCSNSYPEESNNLSYALLKNGAVSTVGCTRDVAGGPITDIFYLEGVLRDNMSCSKALLEAKQAQTVVAVMHRIFVVYGDPSLSINITTTQTQTSCISGYVRSDDNSAISGARVELTGGSSEAYTTSSSGYYKFDQLEQGKNYTITVSRQDYTFNPDSITITSLDADKDNINFTGGEATVPDPELTVSDEGETTDIANRLKANWTLVNMPEGAEVSYMLAVTEGSETGSYVVNYFDIGQVTEFTCPAELEDGKTYYIHVKAVDINSVEIVKGVSDGITIELPNDPDEKLIVRAEASDDGKYINAEWELKNSSENVHYMLMLIRYNLSGGQPTTLMIKNAGESTEYKLSLDLKEGFIYILTVYAYNESNSRIESGISGDIIYNPSLQ